MENYIRKIINIYITQNKLKTPITKMIFNATFFFFKYNTYSLSDILILCMLLH